MSAVADRCLIDVSEPDSPSTPVYGLVPPSAATPKPPSTSMGRRWWLVKNNPSSVDVPSFGSIIANRGVDFKYLCWCYEVGESGTPHIQGFMQTNPMKELSLSNKIWASGPRIKVGRCNEALYSTGGRDYIMRLGRHKDKPGLLAGPFELGDFKTVGVTKAVVNLKQITLDFCLKKLSKREMVEQHADVVVRNGLGLQRAVNWFSNQVRSWQTEVTVLVGASGSGKTYMADEILCKDTNPADYYFLTVADARHGKQWWEGYEGQPNILVDEFVGQWDINYFKGVCGRGAFRVEFKGGSTSLLAKRIVFTSQRSWRTWYAQDFRNSDEDLYAVRRRFYKVLDFIGRYPNVVVTEEEPHPESAVLVKNANEMGDHSLLTSVTPAEKEYLLTFEPQVRHAKLGLLRLARANLSDHSWNDYFFREAHSVENDMINSLS